MRRQADQGDRPVAEGKEAQDGAGAGTESRHPRQPVRDDRIIQRRGFRSGAKIWIWDA